MVVRFLKLFILGFLAIQFFSLSRAVASGEVCTPDRSDLAFQSSNICQLQCALHIDSLQGGGIPASVDCGDPEKQIKNALSDAGSEAQANAKAFSALAGCAGGVLSSVVDNVVSALSDDDRNRFYDACKADTACQLQLGRKIEAYRAKNKDGSYSISDSEVLKGIAHQDINSLDLVSRQNEGALYDSCQAELTRITRELRRDPALADDDDPRQLKFRTRRFENLKKFDADCPAKVGVTSPTSSDKNPDLRAAGKGLADKLRAVSTGVGAAIGKWQKDLHIAYQCYPPEIQGQILCYGIARTLVDPTVLVGLGLEAKVLAVARLSRIGKGAEEVASSARTVKIAETAKAIAPTAEELSERAAIGRPYLDGGRDFKPGQVEALQDAHLVGQGEDGKQAGTLAAKGNYKFGQLRDKVEKLRASGFSDDEIGKLIRNGAAGIDPALALPKGIHSPYISMDDGGVRIPGRIVRPDGRGGFLVDIRHIDGTIERVFVTEQNLGTIRESRGAKLMFEPVSDPKVKAFRDAYRNGDFAGQAQFVSIAVDADRRDMARVLSVNRDGSVQVEIPYADGSVTRQTISGDEIGKIKLSDKSASYYANRDRTIVPRKAVQAAPLRAPQNYFADQHSYSVPTELGVYKGASINGQSVDIQHQIGNRAAADIREFAPGKAANLSPGRYTYAILDDGTTVTGRVNDSLEFGVKHFHLANGRNIVSAGELNVIGNGKYDYNLLSGTFVVPLINSGEVDVATLEKRTSKSLSRLFGREGNYVENRGLLPTDSVPVKNFRLYCGDRSFFGTNSKACCELAGVCR